jgi:hypothetical protein
LDHGTDIVEDNTRNWNRRQYRQHHGKYATKRRADKYGRSDLERGQRGREIGECDSNRVVVGMAIVLGLAMTAIIERQNKSRIVRIGCQRRRQDMKVGCGAGETWKAHN